MPPFSALQKSLHPLFLLETPRTDGYICSEIQQLKDAMARYEEKPQSKQSFLNLLESIKISLLFIEKRGIDFNSIKNPMDALAKEHNMPKIPWKLILEQHPKVSPRFQFNALNHAREEDDLSTWLTQKTGELFTELDDNELAQALVEYSENPGFSRKLQTHLEGKDPTLLVGLAEKSKKAFVKFAGSKVSLHFSDKEIAELILKHFAEFVNNHKISVEQVKSLVNKLNNTLSHGRSVSTLLRNAEAKAVLDSSPFFKTYQSGAFKKQHNTPDSTEINTPLKPNL